MLSSHSIVSSSRIVRQCSPWGGRWIGHGRTTWSTVCSSTPHLQAAEEAIPHLYKQEWKCPTPVQRRLCRTQALLGRVIPRVCVQVSGMWGFPSTPRSICDLPAAPHVCCFQMSDKLMRYCAVSTSVCLDLRCCAFALDGRVSAEWSRCPGSMARHASDSVAPLRRSSEGWMPARIGCLSAGVGRRRPVAIRKASLMARAMMRLWALRQRTGAQYSTVERIRYRVAIRTVVARASRPAPASRLKSGTHNVSFLPSDSRCRRYVSNVTPRFLGLQHKGGVLLLLLTLSSRLASLLLRWKAADTVFVVLSFSFKFWRHS